MVNGLEDSAMQVDKCVRETFLSAPGAWKCGCVRVEKPLPFLTSDTLFLHHQIIFPILFYFNDVDIYFHHVDIYLISGRIN